MTCVLRRRECWYTQREYYVIQWQMKEHQRLLATTRSKEEERKDSAQSPEGLVLLTPEQSENSCSLWKPPGVWHSLLVAPGPAQTHRLTGTKSLSTLSFCLGAVLCLAGRTACGILMRNIWRICQSSADVPWMLKLCWHVVWSYGKASLEQHWGEFKIWKILITFLSLKLLCSVALPAFSFAHVCIWLWPQSTFSLVICPLYSTQHCCYIIPCYMGPISHLVIIPQSFPHFAPIGHSCEWFFFFSIFNHLDNIAKNLCVYKFVYRFTKK